MTLTLLNDSRINIMQQALDGLAQRQQAIAANIANVDTPGYQRQDVPFEAELRASMSSGGAQLATTSPGHMALAVANGSLLQAAMGGSQGPSTSSRNDGNNVDVDYEMTQMAQTSLRYEMLTQATTSRFSMLENLVMKAA